MVVDAPTARQPIDSPQKHNPFELFYMAKSYQSPALHDNDVSGTAVNLDGKGVATDCEVALGAASQNDENLGHKHSSRLSLEQSEEQDKDKSVAEGYNWPQEPRPHGLPLDTIIEQNSHSTLALDTSACGTTRKQLPRVRSYAGGLEDMIPYDHTMQKRQYKSLEDLFHRSDAPLQTSSRLCEPKPQEPARKLSSQLSMISASMQNPKDGVGDGVGSTGKTRRRTSEGIREIFKKLRASTHKSENNHTQYQEEPVTNQIGQNIAGLLDITKSLNQASIKPTSYRNIAPASAESRSGQLEHIDEAESTDSCPKSSTKLQTGKLEDESNLYDIFDHRKSLRARATPSPSYSRKCCSRFSSPSPVISKRVLTVRNGLPLPSPPRDRSIRFGSRSPAFIDVASSVSSLNRRIRRGNVCERDMVDPITFQAVNDSMRDGVLLKKRRKSSSSSLSKLSRLFCTYSVSSTWRSREVLTPWKDQEMRALDAQPSTLHGSSTKSSVKAPSPLRPKRKPQPNYQLFPASSTSNVSPFLPPPRPWRSFSSMLRIPSSTTRSSKDGGNFICHHGYSKPRPNVYAGRKIKRHWWHTVEYSTEGPESCRKCSSHDIKIRIGQLLANFCFGEPDMDHTDSVDSPPVLPNSRPLNKPVLLTSRSRARGRLSTIYSSGFNESLDNSDYPALHDCPHCSYQGSDSCWRCRRDKAGERFGSAIGRSCGVKGEVDDGAELGIKPVAVSTALRRSSID